MAGKLWFTGTGVLVFSQLLAHHWPGALQMTSHRVLCQYFCPRLRRVCAFERELEVPERTLL